MTLIAVYKNSGDRTVCVGRCDARCYEAVEPGCECICHGANHGAGKERATTNTQTMAKEWIERYSDEKFLGSASWDIPALQDTLFDLA